MPKTRWIAAIFAGLVATSSAARDLAPVTDLPIIRVQSSCESTCSSQASSCKASCLGLYRNSMSLVYACHSNCNAQENGCKSRCSRR